MKELRCIENELVPVYETDTGEKVIYGTELHTVLEVKSKFADWVKNRLNDCEAAENEDFETFSKILEKGRPAVDYIIKLDIAKEMAMLERNEKGKQVRKYFIAIEKKYKAAPKLQVTPMNLSPQLQLLINMELKQKEQDAAISELKEKTEKQEKAMESIKDSLMMKDLDYKRWVSKSIRSIAESPSFSGVYNRFQRAWNESYRRFEEMTRCDLVELVQASQDKARKQGICKSKVKAINKQSVIAADQELREAYATVIREMLVAYCMEVA